MGPIIVFQSSQFQSSITTQIPCLNLKCRVILKFPESNLIEKNGKCGGLSAALLVWWRMAEGAVQWVCTNWLTGRVPSLEGTRGVCTTCVAMRSPFLE